MRIVMGDKYTLFVCRDGCVAIGRTADLTHRKDALVPIHSVETFEEAEFVRSQVCESRVPGPPHRVPSGFWVLKLGPVPAQAISIDVDRGTLESVVMEAQDASKMYRGLVLPTLSETASACL